jgi:amino acid transporter
MINPHLDPEFRRIEAQNTFARRLPMALLTAAGIGLTVLGATIGGPNSSPLLQTINTHLPQVANWVAGTGPGVGVVLAGTAGISLLSDVFRRPAQMEATAILGLSAGLAAVELFASHSGHQISTIASEAIVGSITACSRIITNTIFARTNLWFQHDE